MIAFKCKMCGGALRPIEGASTCECEFCGITQTIPNLDDERKVSLFTRANRLRSACEFDKAASVYESIVHDFPEEAEAYWGIILCNYGIEYVDDPGTNKKIPTCHRSSFASIFDDANFEMVMECSDPVSRAIYRKEAKEIEELRNGIIAVSSKEEPYDIFICYKETDANGNRTIDSEITQDTYDALTEKGYRVFFARISLEDKIGQEYEPYIFAALNSAKIMLVFGTDYEYFNAVWVKNEWSRFLSLIEKGEKKTLIPCYKNIDAYDLPREFARLQAQDMGKVGAIQDLLRGIGKIIGVKKETQPGQAGAFSVPGSALTQRGYMSLEDEEYQKAEELFERALDSNPNDSEAYLGKLLAVNHISSLEELGNMACNDIGESKIWARAMQFADQSLKQRLSSIKEKCERNYELFRLISVLERYIEKSSATRAGTLIREIYCIYLGGASNKEKLAGEKIRELEQLGKKPRNRAARFVSHENLILAISRILQDDNLHSGSDLRNMPLVTAANTYASYEVTYELEEMTKCGLIECDPSGYYSLIGAAERRQAKELEEANRLKALREEAAKQEERMRQEEKRKKEEEHQAERRKKEESLRAEKEELEKELANLKGLFSGKRRKEIQARLNTILRELGE